MKIKAVPLLGLMALAGCQGIDKDQDNGTPREVVKLVEVKSSERAPKSFPVTQKFGALTVEEGSFSAQSAITPWTSYWFPAKETWFFKVNDGLSVLEKYDLVNERKFHVTSFAADEEERMHDPNEAAWAGLCHAWSIASVLQKEPRAPKVVAGVNFSVGEQKALLLKSYEAGKGLEIYGARFEGQGNEDFNDVYPDQFHRFLQYFVIEQKKPFIMDYDASFPVWTVPVYKIKSNIRKIDETSAEVKTWVSIASPFVQDRNYVGTMTTVKVYSYILKGQWQAGKLLVQDSEWTEDSVSDHPDYLVAFPDKVERLSLNKEIKTSMVDEIVLK